MEGGEDVLSLGVVRDVRRGSWSPARAFKLYVFVMKAVSVRVLQMSGTR
jgi:hypothetical protein